MSTIIAAFHSQAAPSWRNNPSYQAYQTLHLCFTVAPDSCGHRQVLSLTMQLGSISRAVDFQYFPDRRPQPDAAGGRD